MIACVSSGYSDNPALADPARYGFSAVIANPYLYKELLSALQEAVAKKALISTHCRASYSGGGRPSVKQ